MSMAHTIFMESALREAANAIYMSEWRAAKRGPPVIEVAQGAHKNKIVRKFAQQKLPWCSSYMHGLL
jgi:hypothetical protein